jgi:endonuclease YncB( thermonuclease family)
LAHFSWLAATAIALSSITTTVAAAELKVLSIGDGDTIRLSRPTGANKTTVRLACIDAPETSQAPYGNDARQALEGKLAIGTEVSLRTKATDRYGRTVAEVLKGTTNINQALVQSGVAFVYWKYIEGCDRETYSRLENEARLKSLGTTSGALKVPTLALMNLALLILARTAAGIGVSKLVLGQKRRNYSNKATATSIVTAMGKLVRG